MIAYVLTLAALFACGGFLAGSAYEHIRAGGTYDLKGELTELRVEAAPVRPSLRLVR